MFIRVRIYAAFADPGKINYGQELFDFNWTWDAITLALQCEHITMPGDLNYYISGSYYQYESPDSCTVILNAVQTG